MNLSQNYTALRGQLKTGDLLLFSGKSFSSDSIKWVTLCAWSHVGLVLCLPEYSEPCLWEATTDTDVPVLDHARARPGVQLVALEQLLDRYCGQIALRRLHRTRFSAKDLSRLAQLRRRLGRRGYERNTLELMTAAYDGPLGEQRENLSSLFCSELVAESYQALGLVHPHKPSNEYTPADFSAEHESLPWRRGRLGPEIMLKL